MVGTLCKENLISLILQDREYWAAVQNFARQVLKLRMEQQLSIVNHNSSDEGSSDE